MATSDSTSNVSQFPLVLEGENISILLTKGFVTMVNAIDSDLLQYKWSYCGSRSPYAKRSKMVKGKSKEIYLHRTILERKLGRDLLVNEVVDHIDNDTLNNRRDNLRIASLSENQWNSRKPKNNTTGYKGVRRSKGTRYRSSITVKNKYIYLGCFATAELAYAAYCEAAKKYHGEFARLE